MGMRQSKLSDIEQAMEMAKDYAPLIVRILAHLPIPWRNKQTQQPSGQWPSSEPPTGQPLHSADVAAIKELQESGLQVAYYKGAAIEVEAFQQAVDGETERLASNTLNTVSKIGLPVDWAQVDLGALSPEFLRRWTLEACNVSDETLQTLWARLLKGELETPGSVSNDTMSIARDMNKARAEEFQLLCSAALYQPDGMPMVVVGCGRPGKDSLRPYGLSFDVLMRLVHHRLIISEMDSRLNLGSNPRPLFAAHHQGKAWLMVSKTETTADNPYRPINGLLFTPSGEELFRVIERIPVPEYTAAMFDDLDKQGWAVTPVSTDT